MSQMYSIFEYRDYKKYLKDHIQKQPKRGHGLKSSFAKAMACQVAYVSRVLNGHAHLSPEQAERLNLYLGHSEEAADYFIILVQYARAGTQTLKKYFLKKINIVLKKRLILKERFKIPSKITLEQQVTYYSHWFYAAVHVMLSIPKFQTKEDIANGLNFSLSKVTDILDFLLKTGLIIQKGSRYIINKTRIHLGNDSPLISKHHINWRMQAIQRLDQYSELNENLHYSSIVSLSEKDVYKIKSLLVKTMEETNDIVKSSKEELIHCLGIDFFQI